MIGPKADPSVSSKRFIVENRQLQFSKEAYSLFQKYKNSTGDEALEVVYKLYLLKEEIRSVCKPHVAMQIVKEFFLVICPVDPLPFHFDIARKILSKKEIDDSNAVDLLARRFLEHCKKINAVMKLPECLISLLQSCSEEVQKNDGLFQSSPLEIMELGETSDQFENHFIRNGMFLWDWCYVKIVSGIGRQGKDLSQKVERKLKSHLKRFQEAKNGRVLEFLFIKEDVDNTQHFYHSPAFLGLCEILWHEEVEKLVKFSRKNIPSLSTNVHVPICRILGSRSEVVERHDQGQIQIFEQNDLLGTINIPVIPGKILPMVFKGASKLNSVYGHKLIRFQIQEPFRKMVLGDTDYRVIKLDRGKSELAEILGFKGRKAVTIIGEILYAEAYFNFSQKGISGNLIQLTNYRSPITHRDDGLLITVGTMLLPFQTFEAYRNGECGLLIPLLKDPPLVGSNNRTIASLYSLQMNIMAEFSKQSVELFRSGCIHISKDCWEEFCWENKISPSFSKTIHDAWTQDSDTDAKFLEKVEDEFYTLGAEYSKEVAFLKDQGKKRVQASKAGKKSYEARKRKAKKTSNQ